MPIENWARGQYQEGGGDAFVAFWVFGDLGGELRLSAEKHRVTGMPLTVEVNRFARGTPSADEVFQAFTEHASGPMAEWLERDPALAKAVRASAAVYRIVGEVPDPDDLLYLRNVIGLVQAMLESGGVGVADQALHWWSADGFRREVFGNDVPQIGKLVSILVSDDDDGSVWLHTRGMRLFGRPDVSVERVTPDVRAPAEDLVQRLVNLQAQGGVVPDGHPVKMAGIPAGWTCRHAGSLDDPDFNNVHLAIGPG